MPRGFLVKRSKNAIAANSYRGTGEDRSDSGSDTENIQTHYGSPDSGYSASPKHHHPLDQLYYSYWQHALAARDHLTAPVSLPAREHTSTSPLRPISTWSPLSSNVFDRLTVSTTPEKLDSPTKSDQAIQSTLSEIQCGKESPNKRRVTEDADECKNKFPKKSKAIRKINFDVDKSSPVSGTIILERTSFPEGDDGKVICGDIDSKYNCVEATPEARAEIERIENKIGDYVCQLCKGFYDDAFELAKHRCACIVHIEYRCPECDKVFNCPANLASHRRWHKPRPVMGEKKLPTPALILPTPPGSVANGIRVPAVRADDRDALSGKISPVDLSSSRASPLDDIPQFHCDVCGKKFRRQAYLKKHYQIHAAKPIQGQDTENSLPSELFLRHELQNNTFKEFSCLKCNCAFSSKAAYDKHMRMHAGDVYTCKYCSSSFYSSPGLTRHINKCHPTENKQVILLQFKRPC